MKTISRTEITDCITNSVISYFVHKRMAVFKEIGIETWGRRRADVLCLSMKKREITLVEIKSCEADFLTDKKWETYLAYCNKMYFAVHGDITWVDRYKDLFKQHGIGILHLTQYGTMKVILNCKYKKMKKKHKLDILVRLAWRSGTYSLRTHSRRYAATSSSGIRFQTLAERKR